MTETCRTCLIETVDFKSLGQTFEINGKIESFSNMFSVCTGLEFSEMEDELPQHICSTCTKRIIESYIFRQSCWECNLALKIHLIEQYKLEPNEKDYEEDHTEVDWIPEMIEEELTQDSISLKNNSFSEDIEDVKPMTTNATGFLKLKERLNKQVDIDFVEKLEDIKLKPKRKRKPSTRKVCPVCGKILSTTGNLNIHLRTHTGEKPHKCKFCDYRAAHFESIVKHTKCVHIKTRDFVCEYPDCGKTYTLKTTLQAHQFVHREPTFECIPCQKKFHKRQALKNHMAIHNVDAYLACEFCDKRFPRKTKLNEHRRIHTKEFSHHCSECGKGFIQRHCWRTHMEKHHQKIVK